MKERKARERLEARARRAAIPPDQRAARSARIAETVLGLPELALADTVACYVSVRSEVETGPLLDALLASGRRVGVPRMRDAAMTLIEIRSRGELSPGTKGIPEPPASSPPLPTPGVVLVPGLMFTEDGHRLGQGGGAFDRLLRAIPSAVRVGLAFEEQLARVLPIETHDIPMDVVVTDVRVRRAPRP